MLSYYFVYPPGTLLHSTLTAAPRPQPTNPQPDESTLHSSHEDVDILPESCVLCEAFYTSFVQLSEVAVESLEHATRHQSDSSLWHMARRLRITASTASVIPKLAKTSTQNALQTLVNPQFRGNAATAHGIKYEPVARKKFIEITGLTVGSSGTVVCQGRPWLSASPDGLITSRNAILEIKCPNVLNCKEYIARGGYDVRMKDGIYFLPKTTSFYSQVQLCMLCTETKLCFLYVWSAEEDVSLLVKFDEAFLNENLARLERFYFCQMLPELERRCREGIIAISSEYRQLCAM
uniref:Putative phage-type endonuclease n=1 Tax=Ixodes ricinus TaxID=34613 RepID=A0A6B0V6C3_IXORI